jgi:hypothetical protein
MIEWGVFGNLYTIRRVLQPSISTRLSADKGRALIQITKKKNLSIRLRTVVSEPGGAKSTTLITRDLFGGGDSVESESQELDLNLQVPSGWEKCLDLKNIFCKCQFFCLFHEIIERFLFKIMIFFFLLFSSISFCWYEYWFTLKSFVRFLRKCRNRKWKFKMTSFHVYVKKKKEAGSQPGLPGSPEFRVDRVFLGQLPGGFLLRPGPVPCSGRPGPGSTRRAGPSFKTMGKIEGASSYGLHFNHRSSIQHYRCLFFVRFDFYKKITKPNLFF